MPRSMLLVSCALLVGVTLSVAAPAQNNQPPAESPEAKPEPASDRETARERELERRRNEARRRAEMRRPRRTVERDTPRQREYRRPSDLVELVLVTGNDKPLGNVVIELHRGRAPRTVLNFLNYVEAGFYDGTIFHRVLPGYVVQGGGYTAPGERKVVGLRPPIRNESRRAKKNERGTIALARKADPHTGQAQFYINLADNDLLDFPKAGAYGYTVFGEIIAGMDVIDRIAQMKTRVSDAAQRRFEHYKEQGLEIDRVEQSLPVNPPKIKTARVLPDEEYEQRYAGDEAARVPEPAAEEPAPEPDALEEEPLEEEREEELPEEDPDEPEPIDPEIPE